MSASYQISWNKFQKNISEYLQSMLAKDFLTDVSLYSGNQTWKVHRVVLCANSGYFEQLLRGLGVQQHPVLVLDHIHPEYISYLLEYIYTGNINIEQGKVQQFIQVSKMLQIRGISTDPFMKQDNNGSSSHDDLDLTHFDDLSSQHSSAESQNSSPIREHNSYKSNKNLKRKRQLSTRRNSGKSGRLPAPTRRSGLSADDQSQDSDLEICDVSRDKMVAPTADSVQVKRETFVEVGLMEDNRDTSSADEHDSEIKTDPDAISDSLPENMNPHTRFSEESLDLSKSGEELEIKTGDNERWTTTGLGTCNTTGLGSLSVRSDLLPPIGAHPQRTVKSPADIDRCHFCSLHCGSQAALTLHLKSVHMPPKHALCENCENFFHVCAIARHKIKCQTVYQADNS